MLVARPPRILVDAGICPETELWEISHAVYGLNDAPANWSSFRDGELPQLRFDDGGINYKLVRTAEPNLWKVIQADDTSALVDEKASGFLAVYVDDMLIAAPDILAKAVVSGIRSHWRCSEPEWADQKPLKFCGFEIACKSDGIALSQSSYTGDLLNRQGNLKNKSTPMPSSLCEDPEPEVSIETVRRAQGLVGELLWLASRTRPDTSYGVAIMGRLVTSAQLVFWNGVNICWDMFRPLLIMSFFTALHHQLLSRSLRNPAVDQGCMRFRTPLTVRMEVVGTKV